MIIHDYAERDDLEALESLERTGFDINSFHYDKTALHSACVTDAKRAAKYLIKLGIDVNARDKITGAVALHYCATYNYYDIARLILENGGKLDICDDFGNEPLWTAVFNLKKDLLGISLIELFLKSGANKNHKNKAGRSPQDFATQVNFPPLLNLLGQY